MASRRQVAVLALALLCLAAPASRGGVDTDENLRKLAAAAGQGRPVMRIGLATGPHVRVSSRAAYRILDPRDGSAIWRPGFDDEVNFVAEGGPSGEIASVYRVQTGAFGTREAAEAELQRLSRGVGVPGVVRHNPDRGNWRVRIGAAAKRLDLNPLMARLRDLGLGDLWIAEEPAQEVSGVELRLVDSSFDSYASGTTRLVVVPGKQRVEIDGKPYRGIVEIRVTAFGTLRAVNWVELDKYLLGVVPAELGPEVWPELEALKAQAVAARTYAWRNRGQFDEEGFDICDQPRCQVYKGASAEHPLSDRAVWATRREVLTWQDRPIVALYSATCGGHTEDGAEIFAEHAEPYLKGVPCRAENDAMTSLRGTVRGAATRPAHDETGSDVTRDWTLLRAVGVMGATEPADRGEIDTAVDAERLRGWTRRLARLCGIPAPADPPRQIGDLGQAASALLADMGWAERAEVLLSDPDLEALLRDASTGSLPRTQRRSLAYLAWIEALQPFSNGSFEVERVPSGARLVPALARIGEAYHAFGLRSAVVAGMGRKSIRFVQGKGEIRLPLASAPFLFGLTGGKPVAVEKLELWPGDRVGFRTDAAGAVDFLELQPPVKGASDDRSAAVYAWTERKTRRQLEAAINLRVSVGRLKDLQVVRRGISGRVVELRVVGSQASTIVRGFDVRRLLDLRDILTVIEIQRDEAGELVAAVFSGKGWGHGVGLCQVGAYGMALRGADYREILGHYYRDTALRKIRDTPEPEP